MAKTSVKILHYTFGLFVPVFLGLSCSNSSQPLIDGYTLTGTVINNQTNSAIDSVQIFESTVNQNPKNFIFTGIITDSAGNFTYKTGPGTGPSDELFLFKHPQYNSKEIELKSAAMKIGSSKYDLQVRLNPVEVPDTSVNTTAGIPFHNHLHSSLFFMDEPDQPLVIIRSAAEERQFLDTTRTVLGSFNFASYDDSLLIVLRSPHAISPSNHFGIDSLIPDSALNLITVYAHNHFPVNRMSHFLTHSHIVAIPQTDMTFDCLIEESYESTNGVILPFVSNASGIYASYSGEIPFLITLNNLSEQNEFLNKIMLSGTRPEINYSDSALVGVFSQQFNHVTTFEIVSLIRYGESIRVYAQYFGVGMLPSAEKNYHFVGIKKTETPIVLESIVGVYPWYD